MTEQVVSKQYTRTLKYTTGQHASLAVWGSRTEAYTDLSCKPVLHVGMLASLLQPLFSHQLLVAYGQSSCVKQATFAIRVCGKASNR